MLLARRVLSPPALSAFRRSSHDAFCAAAARVTAEWLDAVVLAHGLCPFASRGSTRCAVSSAATVSALLPDVLAEARALVDLPASQPASTLLVAPRCEEARQFISFLGVLAKAEAALTTAGLEGTLQLVGFHPAYVFQGESPDDAAAYTNRSPFPTLHLLREADVSLALRAMPDAGEAVPTRNAEKLRRLGVQALSETVERLRARALRDGLGLPG